jgi:hypothetical protein
VCGFAFVGIQRSFPIGVGCTGKLDDVIENAIVSQCQFPCSRQVDILTVFVVYRVIDCPHICGNE